MKTLLKLAVIIGVAFFIRQRFFDHPTDLREADLLPLKVSFVQGPAPPGNQPLLMEFWATWCGPCRQSIPHINELYAQYHPRGLYAVGITQEEAATVEGFMHQVPMHYAVALDTDGHYFRELKIEGIPHAFLINREGKVIWDGHPMQLTAAEIEKVLKP